MTRDMFLIDSCISFCPEESPKIHHYYLLLSEKVFWFKIASWHTTKKCTKSGQTLLEASNISLDGIKMNMEYRVHIHTRMMP
jgi:hypothetical protein